MIIPIINLPPVDLSGVCRSIELDISKVPHTLLGTCINTYYTMCVLMHDVHQYTNTQ